MRPRDQLKQGVACAQLAMNCDMCPLSMTTMEYILFRSQIVLDVLLFEESVLPVRWPTTDPIAGTLLELPQ